ncbi:MAG: polysaccharide biosynthesis C-terminal domain-containing protein [Candidatus Omnitrophota bacterium]|nr:polysaccharide biosynthesis C-terminal domain-containing protein [Candidatus Omnitrophota bacterium]
MSETKKSIIKATFELTFARYVSQGIGFFTSIAMRRFLGPFYTGIWSILKIISDYSSYISMGVAEGAGYEIPFNLGRDNRAKAERVKDLAFSLIFLASLAASLMLLVSAIVFRNRYPAEVVAGLLILSVYIILDRLCGYYMLLLRARNNFNALSKSIIFDAAINLILVMLLVRNYNIYGLYMAIMAVSALNIIFMHMLVKYKVSLSMDFRGLPELIKVGFPITVIGFLDGILISVDRIMIAKMIGVVFVGYYSISIMAKNYIAKLSSFGTVLYPYILKDYGKRQNMEDIKKYAIIPPKVNAYILPLLLGLIFFIAPVFIKLVLPKFTPGILAIQILLIDMFFRSCSPQAVHFLIVIKDYKKIVGVILVCIIVSVIGNYILIRKGFGIYGVAWATSIASLIYFSLLQVYALRYFMKPKEIVLFFIEITTPFIYSSIVILLLEFFVKVPNIYGCVLVKSVLLSIAMLPFLIYINARTNIIYHMLRIYERKTSAK